MLTNQLTSEILSAAIEGFELRKARLDEQIAQVRQLMNGHRPVAGGNPLQGGAPRP